jgi:cytoskeleton protein RodZ
MMGMSDRHTVSPGMQAPANPPPLSAGAQLQLAREDAGLTLEAVAAQLKLAPRQVEAIENDDYALLPGRTFVRGFVRNYARLLQLDPDAVLAALPGGASSSLDSPALHATAHTMGELPITERARVGWARWVIPLTLLAMVSAAAVYEFGRQDGRSFSAWRGDALLPSTSEPLPATNAPPSPSPGATNQPLPNPLAGKETPAEGAGGTAPATATTSAAAKAPATTPAAEATIAITFHDKAWTEIRDNQGRVLVSQLMPGGKEQTFSGEPPFDLVIGNATEVNVTYKGETVDLLPHIKSGVARLKLN